MPQGLRQLPRRRRRQRRRDLRERRVLGEQSGHDVRQHSSRRGQKAGALPADERRRRARRAEVPQGLRQLLRRRRQPSGRRRGRRRRRALDDDDLGPRRRRDDDDLGPRRRRGRQRADAGSDGSGVRARRELQKWPGHDVRGHRVRDRPVGAARALPPEQGRRRRLRQVPVLRAVHPRRRRGARVRLRRIHRGRRDVRRQAEDRVQVGRGLQVEEGQVRGRVRRRR